MSRAMNKIATLEEIAQRLDLITSNLEHFANRLTNLPQGGKRESLNKSNSVDRPRNNFFTELDGAVNTLASSLGYLDGLVSNLDAEVFGEPGSAPATPSKLSTLVGGIVAKSL